MLRRARERQDARHAFGAVIIRAPARGAFGTWRQPFGAVIVRTTACEQTRHVGQPLGTVIVRTAAGSGGMAPLPQAFGRATRRIPGVGRAHGKQQNDGTPAHDRVLPHGWGAGGGGAGAQRICQPPPMARYTSISPSAMLPCASANKFCCCTRSRSITKTLFMSTLPSRS